MALRVCSSIFTTSRRFSIVSSLSAPLKYAPTLLGVGRTTTDSPAVGCRFSPVSFISSDAFLNRLVRSKADTDIRLDNYPASVPPDLGEHISSLVKDPDQPANPKVLKVAIIGSPNAGKSTLSNQLLGRKVFAVSKKVHTTKSRTLGVLTEDDTQIIVLDTPGLTTPSKVKKHQLEKSLLVDPWNTVKEADLMVVLVDVSDKWRCDRLDFEVLKCLALHADIPAILVLNKVDLLNSKSRLLELTSELTAGVVDNRKARVKSVIKPPRAAKRQAVRDVKTMPEAGEDEAGDGDGDGGAQAGLSKETLRALSTQKGWPHFKDVFMLSAVDAGDVEALRRQLVSGARPGPWQYHSEVLTDQTPEEICTSIIREKLLEYLPAEVPYTVTQSIEFWEDGDDGVMDIAVKLHVAKESQMKMVIGQAGKTVTRIATEAGEDLSSVFLREVKLRLSVKTKK